MASKNNDDDDNEKNLEKKLEEKLQQIADTIDNCYVESCKNEGVSPETIGEIIKDNIIIEKEKCRRSPGRIKNRKPYEKTILTTRRGIKVVFRGELLTLVENKQKK